MQIPEQPGQLDDAVQIPKNFDFFYGNVERVTVRIGGDTGVSKLFDYKIEVRGTIELLGKWEYNDPKHPAPKDLEVVRGFESQNDAIFPLIHFFFVSPKSPRPPAKWLTTVAYIFLPFSAMDTVLSVVQNSENLKTLLYPSRPGKSYVFTNIDLSCS